MVDRIHKYPRTLHIEGSKQEHDDAHVSFNDIVNCHVIIEEKMDGANSGISFDTKSNKLLLQSRGHFLTQGGYRERHWELFKTWANCHSQYFKDVLQDRYIMYGEWLYAKHTIFYDMLPHYFMEFDIYDKKENVFLSTQQRKKFLAGSPITSVNVIFEGQLQSKDDLTKLVRASYFKTGLWKQKMQNSCINAGINLKKALDQTEDSDYMEGLYIKVEDEKYVTKRLKFVRASFLQTVIESETHWLNRPIIPNSLAPGVNLW